MTGRIITVGAVKGLCICGHDPCDGLDCGVFLPRQTPRKRIDQKPAAELAEIRARAWETRRAKYGRYGHR